MNARHVLEYVKANHVKLGKTGAVIAGFVYATKTQPDIAASMLVSIAGRAMGFPEEHMQHHQQRVREFFNSEVKRKVGW